MQTITLQLKNIPDKEVEFVRDHFTEAYSGLHLRMLQLSEEGRIDEKTTVTYTIKKS